MLDSDARLAKQQVLLSTISVAFVSTLAEQKHARLVIGGIGCSDVTTEGEEYGVHGIDLRVRFQFTSRLTEYLYADYRQMLVLRLRGSKK